jgi:hypothetical protein
MKEPSDKHEQTNRQRIAEAVLADRLNLNDDWGDSESISPLPKVIPRRDGKLPPGELKMIRQCISELTELGCRPEVLYWCLSQMGRDAEKARAQGPLITKFREGEDDGTVQHRIPALPTRADMNQLIAKVNEASKLIHLYQEELLICAELLGDQHRWPADDFSDEFKDSGTSMHILKNALGWVKKLARFWETPGLSSLLKSTSVLYSLVYVWSCSHRSKRRAALTTNLRNENRLANKYARTIANLADSYCGMQHDPDALNDKLQDFHEKHPVLFRKMVSLLDALHEKAIHDSTH